MTSHEDVAKAFAQGIDKIKGSRMFVEDGICWSYGRHFPISKHFKDDVYLFNSRSYSSSTAKHKNYVARALSGKTLIKMDNCDTNNAQFQVDNNMAEIHVCLQKLTRARKRQENIIWNIRELMEQNNLIKQHIQNVTETSINIWELVEQLKNKLSPELHQKLEEVRTQMVLRKL